MVISVLSAWPCFSTRQHYLQSDEALVGMIAMDIMEGERSRSFRMGTHMRRTHRRSLLMAPLFKAFGSSDFIVAAFRP